MLNQIFLFLMKRKRIVKTKKKKNICSHSKMITQCFTAYSLNRFAMITVLLETFFRQPLNTSILQSCKFPKRNLGTPSTLPFPPTTPKNQSNPTFKIYIQSPQSTKSRLFLACELPPSPRGRKKGLKVQYDNLIAHC